MAYGNKGSLPTALTYLNKAVKIQKEKLGDNAPETLNSLAGISAVESLISEFKRMEPLSP